MRTRTPALLIAFGFAVTACGSTHGTGAPSAVKSAVANDTAQVVANIENVQIALGDAIRSATQDNLTTLAQTAQTAHDNLDAVKTQVAVDGPSDGKLYGAVDELKNSMGALVAYTSNPNAGTLGSFNSQWQTATSDWNTAVTDLYAGHPGTPPTIGTQ